MFARVARTYRRRSVHRLVVIALALSAVPPAGAMAAESRVHTGSPVAVPPYMAFLTGSTDDAYWTCGATAISRNVVLTAAHCVLDPATEKYADSANLGLVFGQDDPRAALAQHTAKITRVVRYVASAYYGWFENGVVTHDVAVLQTQDPVPGVIPILPPERTDMLKVGSQGWFMGWAGPSRAARTTRRRACAPLPSRCGRRFSARPGSSTTTIT
jgi:hypothetical protein